MDQDRQDRIMDSRARRAARRAGLYAIKSRKRSFSLDDFGRYQLISDFNGMVMAGDRFELWAEEVIAICAEDAS